MTERGNSPAVSMRGIVKRFPGVVANDGVDFEAMPGEIHALLGENGAGKTTLMNVLYGIYRPDEGEIFIHGERKEINSPNDAIHLGIGMIHQQFRLVEPHTVTENIVLGMGNGFLFNDRETRRRVRELAERYNLNVDPDAYIWQLSAGEHQRVEILKVLYRGAEIMILDEPTSMLTPGEIDELLRTLHRMAAEGKTIIFITHKLDEVTAASDRVTVLRKGKVVATLRTEETNERELARMMVGREVLFRLEREQAKLGETVLEVKGLKALDDRGLPALRDITLEVRASEILGLAGVAGNGQREMVEVLTGQRPCLEGQIYLNGEEITHQPPRARIDAGMACVPGERLTALIPTMSIAENMVLKNYRLPPVSQGPFLDKEAVQEQAARLIEEYAIATPDSRTPIKLLSGGNIQRALLARELSMNPVLLVAAHPTSGLDVGATETIWQLLLEQRAKGLAVLLISEALEEIMTLSDRVAVLYEGEIMGIVPSDEDRLDEIGLMMAGAHRIAREDWA